MIKLHLGCGQTYYEGYVNIDFPQTEHTVQKNVRVDKFADLVRLNYPADSIEEIRSHHAFEHFTRPTALALLCRWRDFLKIGGLLRIETPDALECFRLMIDNSVSFDHKQQVMRHLFGSHEAKWAMHLDGWYKEKFEYTLSRLGYSQIQYKTNQYGILRNIEVYAYKSDKDFDTSDYRRLVEDILILSTVKEDLGKKARPEGSELDMLGVWMNDWEEVYTFSP